MPVWSSRRPGKRTLVSARSETARSVAARGARADGVSSCHSANWPAQGSNPGFAKPSRADDATGAHVRGWEQLTRANRRRGRVYLAEQRRRVLFDARRFARPHAEAVRRGAAVVPLAMVAVHVLEAHGRQRDLAQATRAREREARASAPLGQIRLLRVTAPQHRTTNVARLTGMMGLAPHTCTRTRFRRVWRQCPPCKKHSEKSDRRFVLNDGVPESRHQDASMVVRGLFRFIIFTGPYPAARFG